jgi:hypothetical protein
MIKKAIRMNLYPGAKAEYQKRLCESLDPWSLPKQQTIRVFPWQSSDKLLDNQSTLVKPIKIKSLWFKKPLNVLAKKSLRFI